MSSSQTLIDSKIRTFYLLSIHLLDYQQELDIHTKDAIFILFFHSWPDLSRKNIPQTRLQNPKVEQIHAEIQPQCLFLESITP